MEEKEKYLRNFFDAAIIAIMGFILGGALALGFADNNWQASSVENGHGEWVVIDHEQKWKWKECATCVPKKSE